MHALLQISNTLYEDVLADTAGCSTPLCTVSGVQLSQTAYQVLCLPFAHKVLQGTCVGFTIQVRGLRASSACLGF